MMILGVNGDVMGGHLGDLCNPDSAPQHAKHIQQWENQKVTDVIGGCLDAAISTFTVYSSALTNGQTKVLAVTSKKRWAQYPDFPPVDNDVPDYEDVSWLGLAGPAGLPAASWRSSRAPRSRRSRGPRCRTGGRPWATRPARARPRGSAPASRPTTPSGSRSPNS